MDSHFLYPIFPQASTYTDTETKYFQIANSDGSTIREMLKCCCNHLASSKKRIVFSQKIFTRNLWLYILHKTHDPLFLSSSVFHFTFISNFASIELNDFRLFYSFLSVQQLLREFFSPQSCFIGFDGLSSTVIDQ